MYPHGNGTDLQTASFNNVKEHLILNIQSEFLNGSDIVESIHKGVILYLSNKIPIQRISEEDEPSGAEQKNEFFKAMWNIQIDNNAKREKNRGEHKKSYVMAFKESCPSQIQNKIKDNPG